MFDRVLDAFARNLCVAGVFVLAVKVVGTVVALSGGPVGVITR